VSALGGSRGGCVALVLLSFLSMRWTQESERRKNLHHGIQWAGAISLLKKSAFFKQLREPLFQLGNQYVESAISFRVFELHVIGQGISNISLVLLEVRQRPRSDS
jgi:hypothetical protein